MQLTIKNETQGNGAGGTTATSGKGAKSARTSPSFVDRTPRSAVIYRRMKGSVGDITEAVLQMLSGTKPYVPTLQVRENKDAIDIIGTLTDIDEDSLVVTFEGRFLRINGTKIGVRERTRRKYRLVQTVYRTFERAIPIYCDVDRDKAVATLRKDILRVHVPKTEASRNSVTSVPVTTTPTATS